MSELNISPLQAGLLAAQYLHLQAKGLPTAKEERIDGRWYGPPKDMSMFAQFDEGREKLSEGQRYIFRKTQAMRHLLGAMYLKQIGFLHLQSSTARRVIKRKK